MGYLQPYLSSSTSGKVDLNGAKISVSHQNNLNPPSFPGKFTASDQIGTVDFVGYESDEVTINGIFDEKVQSKLSDLKTLSKETGSVYLYDPVFYTAGTQLIQIESLSYDRSATDGIYKTGSDTTKGTIINYSIKALLTE